MSTYRCLVISREGQRDWRLVDAPDQNNAVAKLRADGHTPLKISSGPPSLLDRLNQPVRMTNTLTVADQALIMTQLATLIRAGLPIDRSLDLLREQAGRARQRMLLGQVLAHVRGGGTLAQAIGQLGSFPAYVIGVVRSAERTGRLGDALAALAERLTMAASTRRQLITALTYPAAVLVATLFALGLVLTLVIPQFAPIFEGQEDRLPEVTRAVLYLSAVTLGHALLLIIAIPILPSAAWLIVRSQTGAALLARHRTAIPGLKMRDQYLAGQFIAIFATLVGNGVSVVNALPLARDAMGSARWRSCIAEVEQTVRAGSRLSAALARTSLVPAAAVRLIEIGEHSGELAQTCHEASNIIAENVRARIERIVALANPIAIISLGGLVGLLVAGVMLGIFSLGDFAG